MKRNKIILLDMDDVLCDLNQSWIHSYNQEYQDDLEPEDVVTWSASGNLKKECHSIQKYFID